MEDQLQENVDKAQEPLLYATTGTLILGDAFTVSQKGVLDVAGGGITPGATVNCGTF
jgi:hypothetical protein